MMMGFGFFGMFLFWGVLLALLIGGGTLVSRQVPALQSYSGRRQPTALQILDGRFARGEISHEEYESIRARIEMPVR